jgi:hypothetical protein
MCHERTNDSNTIKDWPSQTNFGEIDCLALCCYVYVEYIGFVYPAMSMMVIGPSLLY